MKKFSVILLAISLTIFSCALPSNETTYSMDGAIQKGPFQKGSTATVQEVDKNLDPTGRMYTTLTKDDLGSFSLASKFSSQFVEVTSKGFYFNECTNSTASAEISLRSYGDLSLNKPLNLNVLTTIAHGRIKTLVESGKDFSDARNQAESELLELLGFSAVSGLHFYEFSLASGGDDAALLLAISATLQQGRTVAQLSQFIADLEQDFADDGTISDSELITQLRTSASLLNVTTIMNNLKTHYQNRGKTVQVPDFTSYRAALMTAGGIIAKPVFSLVSGTYIEEKAVTITAPTGSEIRYTLDGTTPSIESTKYTSPITLAIGSTITLKAVSILNDVVSEVTTASYIIKNGKNTNNYWVSRPGYFIEYNFSGRVNNSESVSTDYKLYLTFQKAFQTSNYFATLNSTNSAWGKSFLSGPFSNFGTGFTGNSGSRLGSILIRLALLNPIVYEGETYSVGGSNTTVPPEFTPHFLDSWGSFTDVVEVLFDSKNYYCTNNLSINPLIRGTGKFIYAKGIGLVHFELTHSEGTLNGTTDTMTAVSTGDAPIITFTGTFTDGSGNPKYGVTIEPVNHTYGYVFPSDAYSLISDNQPFNVKQYAVPGSYSGLVAIDNSGNQIGTYSFKIPESVTTLDVGDLRDYIAP
ncbi:MAG: chitobiase/beta-hexosaminidase C-terminal domain-containing protein [Rectinemataceae bacterium]|nr:chitobiase/beta-hexosaminidase C-terminal domain-containing protein [Rectinemataceae bacterium]